MEHQLGKLVFCRHELALTQTFFANAFLPNLKGCIKDPPTEWIKSIR